MLCGVIAYPVIGYVFNRLFVGSQVKLGGSVLGDRKLKLTPESLELDGPNFRSVFAWTAVEGTTADKHLLVLWMDRAAGIFIPTSAFASKSDEKVFKDFVDERTAQKR